MPTVYILACAIIFQLTAAVLAIRLIRITGKSTAWILISIALVFMTVRRVIPIYNAFTGNVIVSLDLTNEFIGLILSFLMMLGVAKIAPIFFAVKKSEIELKKSEARFSKIFKSSPIAITLSRLSNESFIDVNDSFLYLVGCTRDEVIGHSALELEIYLDPGRNKELFQALRENEGIQDYEMPLRAKSGNIIETLASFETILIDDEKCVITSIIDITKQKKVESKIQRLTSLYATLNQIDHAVVGARQPEEIFQKTCDAAIQYGGFHMTWIGSLNEKTGKVNPVAHAGHEDSYLKDIDITDRHIPTGRGPTGAALREEKSVICEDIESDPRMEPWRSRAIKHGFRSSASIPLRLRGNVAYALILYANEPYFFNSDQLQLLEEIGTHISFALDTLELETERNRAEEILRKSEARYRFLIENQNDLIIHYRPDTVITFVNDAYCRFYGTTRDELIGNSFLSMVAPEFHEQILKETESIVKNAKPIKGEYLNYKQYGKECWIQWVTQVIIGEDDRVEELQAVGRDVTERKYAEEALRVSENKYHSLIDNMNEGIFISDESGIIQFANKELARIHGYSNPEKMLNKNFRNFIDPSMLERLERNIRNAKEFGMFTPIQDLLILKPDGSSAYINVRSNPILEGERIVGIMGIVQDITERKKAEEASRRSAELYRITFENTGTATILIEEDKTLSLVNTEFEHLSGYSKDEIEGKKKWTEFVVKEDFDRMDVLHKMRRENVEKVPKQYEFRFVDRSGTIHNILLYVDIIKGTKTSIASLLDITERKQVEEALQESELRYRSVLQSATDAIITADGNGNIIGWNRAAERIFGYNYTEAAGQPLISIVPLYHRTAHSDGIKKVLSVEDQQIIGKTIETEGLRKDKSVFPIELSLSTWEANSDQYFTGIIRDITERKQLEDQLRQMQKLEGLGTLAGGISHDFNNILGIILGYISNLKNFKNDTKKLNLAIETITKAVDRGKTLVQQILTFARKTKPAFGALNVNDIIREIMMMVIETFPKVLTYSQSFDEGIPTINADRTQLYQALLNLCVNARDAMPNGGLLAINTRMVSGTNLHNQHPDASGSSYICIEVIDTGEGMTEETRKHIFEPFFTTKELGKGTGLGLSVVFGVIQTHKGFIDVESEIGKGTIFKLYLPTSLATEQVIEKEENILEEIPGGSETLLIVEDEEMLMMSLQLALVEKGYSVITANDGLEALKIYQENKNEIALVITDLGLPTITGLEVCQRIKRIKSNEHMILATGFLDADTKSEFLKAGIKHFLYKPYDIKKVLKMIREVMNEK